MGDAARPRPERNPRLVVTLGLYGSASTWLYNVARELLLAQHGAERVFATYSETVAGVLENRDALGRYVVWKMHYGDPPWDVFADLAHPIVLLTVRDPRDAILSLVERFDAPFDGTAAAIARCCARAMQCAAAGHPVLRYEDRFFDHENLVRGIANYIGAAVPDSVVAAVFARYAPEAVKAFASQVEALPAERLGGDDPAADVYDKVTQIHRGHIGDQLVGKWRHRLDQPRQQALTARFAPFLQRFGYN